MQHPNHHDHDPLLIAADAAGDLADSDRTRARALLDTCVDCADLRRDLLAIASTARSLSRTAIAPRDFRITPEQAARLRRSSWLRRALAPLSGARPMAAAFTSLGIAGILVATLLPGVLGGLGGSAASAPERDTSRSGATASSAGAQGMTAAPAPAAAASDAALPVVRPVAGGSTTAPDFEYGVKDGATSAPDVGMLGAATDPPGVRADTAGSIATTGNPPSLVFVGSLALLAFGLLLFGLRFASRRLR